MRQQAAEQKEVDRMGDEVRGYEDRIQQTGEMLAIKKKEHIQRLQVPTSEMYMTHFSDQITKMDSE